jgi:hypothetical protein
MNRNAWMLGILAGAGAGAIAMYFLDPDRGAKRRSLVRDKFIRLNRQMNRAVLSATNDLANRGYGLMCETKRMLTGGVQVDERIEHEHKSIPGHGFGQTPPGTIH